MQEQEQEQEQESNRPVRFNLFVIFDQTFTNK